MTLRNDPRYVYRKYEYDFKLSEQIKQQPIKILFVFLSFGKNSQRQNTSDTSAEFSTE